MTELVQLTERLTSRDRGVAPWLWRCLLRLLAEGHPVAVEDVAHAAGRPVDDVRRGLAAMPDTEYDQDGRILGYGLSLRPTPHRFEVDGRNLYTWCALDTLIFPAILGRPAGVESPYRVTGAPVRVTVDNKRRHQHRSRHGRDLPR